jgi:histidinol-phosphatase (PHP family)
MYPARELLELCLEAGRPVALSSDAHRPQQLGWEYERAVDWLHDAGVEEIAVFDRRRRRLEPLG